MNQIDFDREKLQHIYESITDGRVRRELAQKLFEVITLGMPLHDKRKTLEALAMVTLEAVGYTPFKDAESSPQDKQGDDSEGNSGQSQGEEARGEEVEEAQEVVVIDGEQEGEEVTVVESLEVLPMEEEDDKGKGTKKFTPPTAQEIWQWIEEKQYEWVDGDAFFDYYEANGWRVNGKPMKNWKASVVSWNSRGRQNGKPVVRFVKLIDASGTAFLKMEKIPYERENGAKPSEKYIAGRQTQETLIKNLQGWGEGSTKSWMEQIDWEKEFKSWGV